MSQTSRLALPFIDAAQSQKHVTHNAALLDLDALVHLSVKARNTTVPPVSPAESDCYLIGAGATGAYSGKTNTVAAFDDGAWAFFAPKAGWRCYVESDGVILVFDGVKWIDLGLALRELQNLRLLGVGATADASNPLSVKLNSALFAAKSSGEGGTGDLRLTLNKSGVGNSVSQLYQSNWSGRAETGLTGDDRFHIKVSPDGAAWKEAVVIDSASGRASFPQGVGDGAPLSFRNRLRNASFAINQRGVTGTVNLAAGAYGHDGLKAGAAGATYTYSLNGLDAAISISAGSLIMPVEAALIEGGVYTLAHGGSAQARVWQGVGNAGSGSYASAPFQTPSLAVGVQTNVEFSLGSVLRPQLEPGPVATAFERRPFAVEALMAQRHFQTSYADGVAPASANAASCFSKTTEAASNWAAIPCYFKTAMRAVPTLSIYSIKTGASGFIYNQNAAVDVAGRIASASQHGFQAQVNNVSCAGASTLSVSWVASAEI